MREALRALGDRPWAPPAWLVAAMVVYAAVATQASPFSWPMRVAVGAASALVVALAVREGWHRSPCRPGWVREVLPGGPRSRLFAGLAVWLVLLGALTVFQLGVFTSNPREIYPTLSSLANATFEATWLRITAFALWLWTGWYLVRR